MALFDPLLAESETKNVGQYVRALGRVSGYTEARDE